MISNNIDNINNIETIKAYRDFIGQEKSRQILVLKNEKLIYQGKFDVIINYNSNVYTITLNSDNMYDKKFYSVFSSKYSKLSFDCNCLRIDGEDKENQKVITQIC